MAFGDKLQQLRKQKGLSQEDLAAQLMVSRQAISKWELDSSLPDTENIIRLSNIFEVSIDFLLKDTPPCQQELPPSAQPPSTSVRKPLTAKLMMLLGAIGVLLFWILSSVFPAVTSYADAAADGTVANEVVKYGLPAFLELHNMGLLFALCCITFSIGLVLLLYPLLKSKLK